MTGAQGRRERGGEELFPPTPGAMAGALESKVVFKESENDKRSGVPVRVGERLVLQFKRYIYDGDKRMHQDDETMVLSPAWLAKNRSNVKEKGRPLGGGGINSKSSPVRLKNVEVIAETSDGSSDVDNGVQIGHFNSLRSSAVPFNPPVKPLRARPSSAWAACTLQQRAALA